jgi:hypothetical protein
MTVAFSAAIPAAAPDMPIADNAFYVLDSSNIPIGMLDLVRSSRAKCLEGSSLISAGESDQARDAFYTAVDLVLQSDWDLASTPALNRFFQDLIQRIQEDESRYLWAPCDTEDTVESAAVDNLDDLNLIPITIDPALKNHWISG